MGVTTASVLPCGTKTLPGKLACGRSLATVTVAPPAGAGAFKVNLAWVGFPPAAALGEAISQKGTKPAGVGGASVTVMARPADHGPATAPCSARILQK